MTLGSSGYDNYHLEFNEGKLCIEADMHIGLSDTLKNNADAITRWRNKSYDKIILLGDTFEFSFCNNRDIIETMRVIGLSTFIKNFKGEIIFIIGNHDYNINWWFNPIRKELLKFPNVKLIEYYEDKNGIFAHGHQYDVLTKKLGFLYILAFIIGDALNLTADQFWKGWKKIQQFFSTDGL
jgi:metallophosphoesterase superfamily enzyme